MQFEEDFGFQSFIEERRNSSKDMDLPTFSTLLMELVPDSPHLLHVKLNRPKKLNAFNSQMWSDIHECFKWIDEEASTSFELALLSHFVV